MIERRTHILLIEDDAADALLVQRSLGSPAAAEFAFRLYRTPDLQSGLARLADGDIDVVLLDLHLPDSQGIGTVEQVRASAPRVPIVVFTTAGDEERAIAALEAGAQDYLVKGDLSESTLRRALRYAAERRRMQGEAEKLQERLLRAEKLESLGMLAGGIAHDFNNLLTVVLANTDLARRDLPEGSPTRSSLNAVLEAARFATRLTEQLLAYSGGAGAELRPLDLSARITEIETLLRRLVPEEVELRFQLAGSLPPVAADPGQIQQLTMNLIKNAAESMDATGGAVEIETGVTVLEATASRTIVSGTHIAPGPVAYLRVRDSGCGMDTETAERMFDPFFSTKFTGRGLGLAACLGIVRTHRGGMSVESEVGTGTRLTVYLPIATEKPDGKHEGEGAVQCTVLVVDDDEAVREAARLSLERFGFQVIEAAGGAEALAIFQARSQGIDLVLLDLTMPGTTGEETFVALREIRSDVPVLLSSGYDPAEVSRRFAAEGVSGFLAKPYVPERLLEKVEEVLGRAAPRVVPLRPSGNGR